jgi:hypothetical protein
VGVESAILNVSRRDHAAVEMGCCNAGSFSFCTVANKDRLQLADGRNAPCKDLIRLPAASIVQLRRSST